MGGSATNSPAVQQSLQNLLNTAMNGRGESQFQRVNPDDYNTKLSTGDEKKFQTWKQKYALKDSGYDYDLRGAYKEGLKPDPQTGHWPDTYKKPNHETFSDESKYADYTAGTWTGPDHDIYQSPLPLPLSEAKLPSKFVNNDKGFLYNSLQSLLSAYSGGLNKPKALDEYTKQVREMPDAAIRGVGDAVAGIPDLAIAGGKLMGQAGLNPRGYRKQFEDTTYMPVNPAIQDMLTRAGVAETSGGNNLTRFMAGALAPAAAGKYVSAVDKAIDAAKAGNLAGQEGALYIGKKLTPTQIQNATPKTSPKMLKEIGITGAELGANKFRIPLENMQADITDLPMRAMKSFDPQNLETGGYVLPLWGDMSRGGGIINEINGTKLANPVRTYGGRDFANENPEAFWASMQGIATRAANHFNSYAEKGQTYPIFTNMGGRSLDSSPMTTNTFLELYKIKPPSMKTSKLLDDMVKSAVNKKGVPFNADAPSFRNLDKLQTWLQSQPLASREAFMKSIDNKDAHDLGIPDLASIRFAVSDQSQIGTPTSYSGTLVGKVDDKGVYTGKPKSAASVHPGYDTLIQGITNQGGFPVPIKPEVMFPTAIKNLTIKGYESFRHPYLMQRGAGDVEIAEKITTKYKDSLSDFIEKALKTNDPFSTAIEKRKFKGAK